MTPAPTPLSTALATFCHREEGSVGDGRVSGGRTSGSTGSWLEIELASIVAGERLCALQHMRAELLNGMRLPSWLECLDIPSSDLLEQWLCARYEHDGAAVHCRPRRKDSMCGEVTMLSCLSCPGRWPAKDPEPGACGSKVPACSCAWIMMTSTVMHFMTQTAYRAQDDMPLGTWLFPSPGTSVFMTEDTHLD